MYHYAIFTPRKCNLIIQLCYLTKEQKYFNKRKTLGCNLNKFDILCDRKYTEILSLDNSMVSLKIYNKSLV